VECTWCLMPSRALHVEPRVNFEVKFKELLVRLFGNSSSFHGRFSCAQQSPCRQNKFDHFEVPNVEMFVAQLLMMFSSFR
jgi:hypothetical protein